MKSLIPAFLMLFYAFILFCKVIHWIHLSWLIVLSPVLAAVAIFWTAMIVIVLVFTGKKCWQVIQGWLMQPKVEQK